MLTFAVPGCKILPLIKVKVLSLNPHSNGSVNSMKNLKTKVALFSIASLFGITQAQAVTMYIGDKDGFGYGNASGYYGADGKPAERTGDRSVLDAGDALPDKDRDHQIVHNKGEDNFDFRSSTEKNDVQNNGQKWTDVSLSLSYDGKPGLAKDAVFTFRFTPPQAGDADYGRDHYISLVYGDYDIEPMEVEVEGKTVELVGNEQGGVDGYIWRAYTSVSWEDMLDGEVVLNIIAPSEPYVAFDYALLDVKKLEIPKPNPTTMLNLLLDESK